MVSTVSLICAQSYEAIALRSKVEELLAPLGGIKKFVKKGDRVLLKPNLLTGSKQGLECITRPEIVYCVAQLVKEAGGKPFLGDSPAFGTARGVAKSNGYLPLIQELKLPVIEFTAKSYPIDSNNFERLRLSKEAMEADVIINLPKIKSHVQLTMTMGVKNLFGCVPGKMKAWWHLEAGKNVDRFADMLVETALAIAPDLTIIDGIIAHEGNGPSGGQPRFAGILGASEDVFALDRAILEILQVNPEIVPTIMAQSRSGQTWQLSQIDFPLLCPSQLQIMNWKLPDKLVAIDFGLPRVLRSTFKHLYIRFIQEPLNTYVTKS